MAFSLLSISTSSLTFKLSFAAAIVVVIAVSFFSLLDQNSSINPLIERRFEESEIIGIVGAVGPESFAFDRHGDGPYAGVSDGRIIKWLRNESRWLDFAVTSPERYGFISYFSLFLWLLEHVLFS